MNEDWKEKVLEVVCDMCHWPYVYRDSDIMHAEKCDHCPIEAALNGKEEDT